MAQHNETGKRGEELAAQHLSGQGFEIICRNWRYGRGEIDIVATKDNILAFVEVKTRGNNAFGEPETFVGMQKQRQLIKTANAYIQTNNIALEARFDVVSVILGKNSFEIRCLEDAFRPVSRR